MAFVGKLRENTGTGADAQTNDVLPPDTLAAEALLETVARNLKRLRTRRGHSLERLAKLSGVSRAMLSQIELGKSAPTIGLLWKIACALGVPFATLISTSGLHGAVILRKSRAKLLTSSTGDFTARALFPFDTPRKVEFYELRLLPGCIEKAEGHQPGTTEYITVANGSVEIETGDAVHPLAEGDSIVFEADSPHTYRNGGTLPARLFLVMSYVEIVG